MPKKKSKWLREYEAKQDTDQSKLEPRLSSGRVYKQVTVETTTLDVTMTVACPFCMHIGKLQSFLVSTKKGISQSNALCPECKQGMRMTSLTNITTPEEYAEFAYPYAKTGFWQKVPFKLWTARMRQIGWLDRFWRRYKELRGDPENESYQDWLQCTQREQHEAESHEEDY